MDYKPRQVNENEVEENDKEEEDEEEEHVNDERLRPAPLCMMTGDCMMAEQQRGRLLCILGPALIRRRQQVTVFQT